MPSPDPVLVTGEVVREAGSAVLDMLVPGDARNMLERLAPESAVVLPLRAGTASLAGVVRDVAGNGLPGAFVAVSPAEEAGGTVRNLWAYANADSTGAYRVDRLPAGAYVVHAAYGTGDAFGQGWISMLATTTCCCPKWGRRANRSTAIWQSTCQTRSSAGLTQD